MKFLPIVLALAATSSFAHDVTGSIGVVSKYIDKGSVENADPTIQAELEYSHGALYLGYFGSKIDYDPTDEERSSSFENDFYIGLTREHTDNLTSYTHVGAYVYNNGSHDSTRVFLTNILEYKNVSSEIEILLKDDLFGSKGDTYFNVAYEHGLPHDVNLKASVGSNYIADESKFEFSHTQIEASKEFGNITASAAYILGHDEIENNSVFALKYSF